jgi:uncharacterized protein YjcR
MGMAKLSPEVKKAGAERTKRKAPRVADWVAIRALYLGGMKSKDIGEKFGINANLIRARAQDEQWFETALESTPRLVVDKIMKQEAEATGAMLSEIWAERGRLIREKEFRIAEKAASHAETMEENQLLSKIDRVKVAIDMGRRSTGLDTVEANLNAVNIAVLGDIGMFENEANAFKKVKPVQPPE